MQNADLRRAVDVDYIGDYTMNLTFSNVERERIDFLPLLIGNSFFVIITNF